MERIGCQNFPVAVCCDDTKLHPALRPYHDGLDDKWKLAGVHGAIPEFSDYSQLRALLAASQINKAEKV